MIQLAVRPLCIWQLQDIQTSLRNWSVWQQKYLNNHWEKDTYFPKGWGWFLKWKVTEVFGALRGAVAFKKIIKVKPTLVQVLPTLISKKNHVLSAANHRELERRTNLALQSSPEDFKSCCCLRWDFMMKKLFFC